jgi:nitrous oxide reductase accessory protein NosL
MKRFGGFIFIMVLGFTLTGLVWAQDDIQKHPSCKYCGMDRAKFAHSRVFIENDDGTTEGTCSLHCAAVDLALNIDKTPKAILVGDLNNKNLVDAEKAFWVIGGNKMGVMTKRAKWAFEKQQDADRFVRENGGVMATFDEVIKGAYEDMYADTKMIREKRKMARMGHKH